MASTDPIFAAIERHRLADAAYDDSIERQADESEKDALGEKEKAALIALLRTQPQTVAGCLASLRYVTDWARNNDAALFDAWSDPYKSAGAAFIPMIADAIEAINKNR